MMAAALLGFAAFWAGIGWLLPMFLYCFDADSRQIRHGVYAWLSGILLILVLALVAATLTG